MRTFSIKINYESFFCSHEGNRFILHITHAMRLKWGIIRSNFLHFMFYFHSIGCGIGLENPFSKFFIYIFSFFFCFSLLPSIRLNAGGYYTYSHNALISDRKSFVLNFPPFPSSQHWQAKMFLFFVCLRFVCWMMVCRVQERSSFQTR